MAFSLYTAVFLSIVIAVFFMVRKEARPLVLLLSSISYIDHLNERAVVVLLVTTAIVYAFGLLIQFFKDKNRNRVAGVCLFVCLFLLVFSLSFLKFSSRIPRFSNLIIPIGFSYYAFQAIGYIVDIYNGKIRAEKNIMFFALYMSFFPKFVSGPIEREEDFVAQVKELKSVRFLDEQRMSEAFGYILYGYFLKLVVADNLGALVTKLFNGYRDSGSLWLMLGSLSYTMQIYCDFAGYSALAVGVSRIFGINLVQNFTAPYLAVNISDFWRRWHRSLSMWLRDYVYIPLGGNRRGVLRQCINVSIVFILCGIWHGNGLNFLVWGMLHGIYSVIDVLIRRKKNSDKDKSILSVVKGRIITFCCVSFAWIFFGASGLKTAIEYCIAMFTAGNAGTTFIAQYNELCKETARTNFLLVFILIVILMDVISYKKNKPFPVVLQDYACGVRYLIYYLIIIAIIVFGLYGPGYSASNFMYMNF
ncbi:MBOAT family O-acyltransferase [Butyrivibrio sp. AE2005]|uniref:MBOAT family O-acyltransferase n=1 Tax=Butyrivibrio sp. AE2005 TaxID=1496722 RepID=UPI000478D8AC|nr:MBOAT family O-acyltransferase [Butyrivibrio sp. AE2005]